MMRRLIVLAKDSYIRKSLPGQHKSDQKKMFLFSAVHDILATYQRIQAREALKNVPEPSIRFKTKEKYILSVLSELSDEYGENKGGHSHKFLLEILSSILDAFIYINTPSDFYRKVEDYFTLKALVKCDNPNHNGHDYSESMMELKCGKEEEDKTLATLVDECLNPTTRVEQLNSGSPFQLCNGKIESVDFVSLPKLLFIRLIIDKKESDGHHNIVGYITDVLNFNKSEVNYRYRLHGVVCLNKGHQWSWVKIKNPETDEIKVFMLDDETVTESNEEYFQENCRKYIDLAVYCLED